MTKINENIRSYLKSYIIEDNHSSAIMLTGPWGCGKTHFVNDFIEVFNEQDKKLNDTNSEIIKNKKLMYISLNGVVEKSEIDRKLLISYLCLENKVKYAGFASHLIQGLMEFKQVPSKVFDSLLKSVEDVSFDKISEFGKDRVVFFDDLERCKIKPQEVMGYVNDFVEHSGSGVILICDSSKLEDEYKNIREKCVKREFEIEPNIESAFNKFINIYGSKYYNKYLENEKSQIFDLMQHNDINNLRTIRNIVADFGEFCGKIKEVINEDIEKIPDSKIKELIKFYLKISFGIFSNIIDYDDIDSDIISKSIDVQLSKAMNTINNRNGIENDSEEDESEENEEKSKYLYELHNLNNGSYLLSLELWNDWFKKGDFSKENIEEFAPFISNLLNEKENDSAWRRLWYWRHLKDSEIEGAYKEVLKDLDNGEYLFAPIVLHSAGILLACSDRKFIKQSKSEIEKIMVEYINKNGGNFEYLSPRSFLNNSGDWGGLEYAGRDFEEFKNIKKLIYEELLIVAEKRISQLKPKIFRMLKNDTSNFYKSLILDEKREGFNDVSVFCQEDVENVFNILVESRKRDNAFNDLKKRYEQNKHKDEFEKEKVFYKSLLMKIDEYISDKENEGKVSSCVLKQICRKEIDKVKAEKGGEDER